MGVGIEAGKDDDFSSWYQSVLQEAKLMDYSRVSGCMVYRPYGYAVWEHVKEFLDDEIKQRGVRNAYFPLFIPESLLEKESSHVEGFSPEVAWVTHGGDSELGERLAVRPTSETIMYDSYSKWIRSHADLPLKMNQWGNVVRWEFKHPTPFLRTREFLWQEGHSAHARREDAEEEVRDINALYRETFEDVLAVPVLLGEKTARETFPGAEATYSLETLLPDGKAIQAATSHMLGQNFAEAFDITFQDTDEETKHVWQTSWGFTTRSLGITFMIHGDDDGLVLPPRVAPVQTVIVPILFSDGDVNEDVMERCRALEERLDVRVRLDERDKTPGWKFHHWELKGVPLRVEIGPDDVRDDQVVLVRRDTGEERTVGFDRVESVVSDMLETIQSDLFTAARERLDDNITAVEDVEGVAGVVDDGGIALMPWCGREECLDAVTAESGGKALNKPFDTSLGEACVCGDGADTCVYVGRSY